jgi:hypothetical protein
LELRSCCSRVCFPAAPAFPARFSATTTSSFFGTVTPHLRCVPSSTCGERGTRRWHVLVVVNRGTHRRCCSTCVGPARPIHLNCNSSSTSVATLGTIIFIRRIATQSALQLQHGNHFNCNSSITSVATLNIYFFIIFISRIATQKILQLQHDKHFNCNSSEHFDCNSASTPVATRQSLQLQLLGHFSCNSKHVFSI